MKQGRTAPTFLPWLVWGVALLFYVIAVVNRTSLASLGLVAQEHFDIQATVLSSFAVLQLVMYAGMQIPVGMLLDRFGVSIVLVAGSTVMFIGQIAMAYTSEVWIAVVARMFLGAGDAGIFISVMRILPDWFPARQLPLVGQVTGQMGAIGQVISLMPLAFVVGQFGWSAGFMGVAAAGMLVTLLGLFVLRDSPGSRTIWERIIGKRGELSQRAEKLLESGTLGLASMPSTTKAIGAIGLSDDAGVFKRLGMLLRIPGIRLAFWVHFTPPFAMTVLLLLWGTPFLVGGVGVDPVTASVILSSTVFVSLIAGLTLGRLTSRFSNHRVHIVAGLATTIALLWLPVFLWPGVPPLWIVVVAIMFTIVGGPGSMVAFEIVRSYSPRRMIGLATGFVNMGGFISALIALFVIGLLLDLQGAGTPDTYSMGAFQWALASQFVLWSLGLWRMLAELKNTKKWAAERNL
ncbi:MAG TPA: MFS transporter [Microbacteriaceae bacterium]|nr:MFS transporter [Microbacteriaceae bacterium]